MFFKLKIYYMNGNVAERVFNDEKKALEAFEEVTHSVVVGLLKLFLCEFVDGELKTKELIKEA